MHDAATIGVFKSPIAHTDPYSTRRPQDAMQAK